MKKIYIILLLVCTFALPQVTHAKSNYSAQLITLSENEIVDRDYFAAGDIVEVFGTINGDAYVAGGTVTFEGTVNGDILAAGGTVTINGDVSQDVRVAGGTVTINANIEGNVTVGGGTVEIAEEAVIGGSLVAGAGTLNVRAPIGKGAKLGSGNLYIANSIGGDVDAGAETIRVAPNANVEGDFNYWSENDAQISESASISGTTAKHMTNIPSEEELQMMEKQTQKGLGQVFGAFKIIHILSYLVFGLLLAKFFPIFTKKVTGELTKYPWSSLGWGFLALVSSPVIAVLLMVTVIGLPLGGILFMFWGLGLYAAKYFSMVFIGGKLFPKFSKNFNLYQSFAAGLIYYTLISFIPVLNFFSGVAFLLFGLGAVVLSLKSH